MNIKDIKSRINSFFGQYELPQAEEIISTMTVDQYIEAATNNFRTKLTAELNQSELEDTAEELIGSAANMAGVYGETVQFISNKQNELSEMETKINKNLSHLIGKMFRYEMFGRKCTDRISKVYVCRDGDINLEVMTRDGEIWWTFNPKQFVDICKVGGVL